MDPIKEAFTKIKEDIFSLKEELSSLKSQLSQLQDSISSLKNSSIHLQNPSPEIPSSAESIKSNNPTDNMAHNLVQKTMNSSLFSSFSNNPTNNPTHNSPLEDLKSQNLGISIGNKGVPTNRQTDQQTDNLTNIPSKKAHLEPFFEEKVSDFQKANEIISSLDNIKREIRAKFKRLTPQEMTVFSTLYALEEGNTEITYRIIAIKLSLSESSIRDYINRLINKGIPINKFKLNNKTILLKISQDLKNIASLATIIQLRDL